MHHTKISGLQKNKSKKTLLDQTCIKYALILTLQNNSYQHKINSKINKIKQTVKTSDQPSRHK